MFSGSIPALVTPFRDGAFDVPAFKRLVKWQIDEGSRALVPCGTTGESPTLSFDEHYRVIDTCVEAAEDRVPVIAGCGSNDTATAIRHMRYAQQAGAAAALIVAPYYNRPTQEGMLAHFKALADACDLPIVVYNVPGRTVADISAETMCRLAEIPNVVATKDASGDLARVTMHRAGAGNDFCQLSGNDDLWLPHAVLGGVGCISVTANIAPALSAQTGMIGPMSTILMGVLILGEPFTAWIAAGTVLLDALAEPVRDCHARQLGHLSDKKLRELITALDEARRPHEDPAQAWPQG